MLAPGVAVHDSPAHSAEHRRLKGGIPSLIPGASIQEAKGATQTANLAEVVTPGRLPGPVLASCCFVYSLFLLLVLLLLHSDKLGPGSFQPQKKEKDL